MSTNNTAKKDEKSGKFVLRVPPVLHQNLINKAAKSGTSLNQLILHQLQRPSTEEFADIEREYSKELLAIILFGSVVRGEQRTTSDIDLLLVLKSKCKVDRALYTRWDQHVATMLGQKYSPQFTHLPKDLNQVSSIWLEVALEGEIKLEREPVVRQMIYEIKNKISEGFYQRKISYGHPYWVTRTADQKSKAKDAK